MNLFEVSVSGNQFDKSGKVIRLNPTRMFPGKNDVHYILLDRPGNRMIIPRGVLTPIDLASEDWIEEYPTMEVVEGWSDEVLDQVCECEGDKMSTRAWATLLAVCTQIRLQRLVAAENAKGVK